MIKPLDSKLIIESLNQYINNLRHIRQDLETEHKWSKDDARLALFAKLMNVSEHVMLGYHILREELNDKNLWDKWQKKGCLEVDVPEDTTIESAISHSLIQFELMLRSSLLQNTLYQLEHSFKQFIKKIDINACNSGNTEFKNLYDWLLKKTEMTELIPLLDLMRIIRNTSHNNGYFFPKNNKSVKIKYKEKIYYFEVGKAPEIANTEFYVTLLPDLTNLLRNLVTSELILNYHTIEGDITA